MEKRYSYLWLQLECQYLQRTVLDVYNLMGLVEMDLRETFSPPLFVGEEDDMNPLKILVRSIKQGGMRIPVP